MNPTVGILCTPSIMRGIPRGQTRHENLSFYEKAAQSMGLEVCYFSLKDIHLKKRRVRAYVQKDGAYVLRSVPLPSVIHNRSFLANKRDQLKIRRIKQSGVHIFNERTRNKKRDIHRILMMDESLRPHLPGTEMATVQMIRVFMDMYDELIIKPNYGSIGVGVMLLQKTGNVWHWYAGGSLAPVRAVFTRDRLPPMLMKIIKKKPHIVQQRLPLATYEGRPFDIRVSVQKDESGQWQLTGMVGKVAAKGKYVTNVAQGGTVYDVKTLVKSIPRLNLSAVKENIAAFSLRVAEQLDARLPHVADVGLDIGITEFGYPVFIECNSRDLRYSFREAGMKKEWYASYRNPLAYAKFLLQHG